jgi:hypothetical protein
MSGPTRESGGTTAGVELFWTAIHQQLDLFPFAQPRSIRSNRPFQVRNRYSSADTDRATSDWLKRKGEAFKDDLRSGQPIGLFQSTGDLRELLLNAAAFERSRWRGGRYA